MMGLLGIAILVGLSAGGIALFSGYSLSMALGFYMMAGWMFLLMAILAIVSVKLFKARTQKQQSPLVS